ncbi:MAG TPA: hypothetical protein VGO43_00055 [Pyrinomonadaceae bacterium]|jgi:hypothetical protein|nr:hypothetical protein [Pyrinomonadaceae bacterium]
MIRKAFFVVVIAALAVLPVLSLSSDPVTGSWDATFHVVGFTITGGMSLKVEGEVVTGTVQTEHTGPGTISNGMWKDGKLSFTGNFEKHESIVFTGTVKDGKLDGEFKTEGNTGQWSAVPHKAS